MFVNIFIIVSKYGYITDLRIICFTRVIGFKKGKCRETFHARLFSSYESTCGPDLQVKVFSFLAKNFAEIFVLFVGPSPLAE